MNNASSERKGTANITAAMCSMGSREVAFLLSCFWTFPHCPLHPVRGDLGRLLWKAAQRVEPIPLELKDAGNVKRNLSVGVIAPELLPETVDFV